MAAAGDMGLTPAMRQYWDVKNKYPDCVVLFRMGDFYETFYDDARTVSQDLNIVLTSRGKDEKKAPLAGIPYHAIDNYLKKFVDRGHKVVIVEQLEDPKLAKGIVKRGVVRIVTPGTVIEPHMVDERANNYIVGVYSSGGSAGLCACDVSTGEMRTTEVGVEEAEAEFEKFRPAEVLLPKDGKGYGWVYMLARERGFKVTELEHYKFDEENGRHVLRKIAGVESFSSYGLEERQLAKRALSGMLAYLDYTLLGHMAVPQLGRIAYYSTSGSMSIDSSTMRNLEVMHSLADGSERGTLQEIINNAATPMGSRAIRKWVSAPLLSLEGINGRLDNVSAVVGRPIEASRLRDALKGVGDIERIATRTAYGTVMPRELLMLGQSLELVEGIKGLLKNGNLLEGFYGKFAGMEPANKVSEIIRNAIAEDAKQQVRDGGVIKKGYSEELDEVRGIISDSRGWLSELEGRERERTGIKSLKIRYNKIIGYYIEVPKTQESKVPPEYIRKQTQVNCERYISPKLKEMEVTVLNAEEKVKEIELEAYAGVVREIQMHMPKLYETAEAVAELDSYLSLAKIAYEKGYCRPKFNTEGVMHIKEGRHPVVESNVMDFVPNDIYLDRSNSIIIITGPNMAGKSTVMRQAALISIMAQMGSFVPASYANLPIFDKVFTRVGARDDISRGQSTFMMEMVESANILNNATKDSLVIFDEIGRGTSTYDGMAIAWAIIEHVAENIGCKTLFATHYHLLNLLSLKYPFVKNCNVAVSEEKDGVVFLHKLVEGGTDKSYGVHVARVAGLPNGVIEKARAISKMLEENDFLHRETLSRLTSGRKGVKEDRQATIESWTV